MEIDVYLRMEITNWLKEVSLQDQSLNLRFLHPRKRLQLIKARHPRLNRRMIIEPRRSKKKK